MTHAARGQRERVRQVASAAGLPFDNGVFELVVEDREAPWGADSPPRFGLETIEWPAQWLAEDPELPSRLVAERDRTVAYYQSKNAPSQHRAP